MLTQFFSNEKLNSNEHRPYFNISNKQKVIFELQKQEEEVVKEAADNIKRNLFKLGN
jgi:hypothetical protein